MSGEEAAQWAGSRTVDVDGTPFRYREAGRGPTVVLVHGLGVSADYWFRNGPALAAAGLRVLAPDLPGFGRSPAGGEAAEGPVRQARALVRWARTLELPPAVYVGHSLSCQTVLETAARAPELVAGVILAAPTSSQRPGGRIRELITFASDVPRESLTLATTVALAYLRAGPLRVMRTWWRATAHDARVPIRSVRAPGLVVVAGGDPVVVAEWAETLAAMLPRGRVLRIEGGSHALQASVPDQFNYTVAEFTRSVLGSAPRAEAGG